MLKVDLHIHSYASKYKEADNIVDESTPENVDVLLNNLEKNEINVFSITDHNRFSPELYEAIDSRIKENSYKHIMNILSGVEFDVKINQEMGKSHIIAIFNTQNQKDNYRKINDQIGKDLKGKEDCYSKDGFEQLLKDIELDVILIACQRKDLSNHNGKHNSFSDTTDDPEKALRIGYIDALEFQKPHVQGILKENLQNLPSHIGLITGSDCHTWTLYPDHSISKRKEGFYPTRIRMLPTFKGLLLAISSPVTRIDIPICHKPNIFKKIIVNDSEIELSDGINAIIGENGSGKSTLLKYLDGSIKKPFEKELEKVNNLGKVSTVEISRVKTIHQNEIINNFNAGSIFGIDQNNYIEIDYSSFQEEYHNFQLELWSVINKNIERNYLRHDLEKFRVTYSAEIELTNYFINVLHSRTFDESENIHDKPRNSTNRIYKSLKVLLKDPYYSEYQDELTTAYQAIDTIHKKIFEQWRTQETVNTIKSTIVSKIQNYNLKLDSKKTTVESKKTSIRKQREELIDAIRSCVSKSLEELKRITLPAVVSGLSKNSKNGFSFHREANYSKCDMTKSFYTAMFTRAYQSEDALINITSRGELKDAIRSCNDEEKTKFHWDKNFEKFLSDSCEYTEYITDTIDNKVGSTLGEQSLAFYKYFTQNTENWSVLMIDQPEDNISNRNINSTLLEYFNKMRYACQIIFITHNPLLVVNLDVDNVIYLENNNKHISVKSGCLEYENHEKGINILRLIAESMDGGQEAIAKRMKVYGKKDFTENE